MTVEDGYMSEECGADASAYALGALEPDEAERFRSHLQSCTICREELTALEQVVSALPMSAPQHPAPRGLKRRVMRSVLAEQRQGTAGRSEARRRQRAPVWVRAPRAALAGAGALVLAAAVIGGAELAGGGSSTRVIQAQVLGAPGSAQLRLNGSHGELIVRHLRPPPAGHIYEVWLKRAGAPPAPTSALFSVTAGGSGDVAVPGNLHGVGTVMVTPEPAGGSDVPTHAPVIVAQLT